MEKFIKYENLYIAILFFLIISVVFYFLPGNIKNNFYIGFVTFFVGCFIIYLYIRQNIDLFVGAGDLDLNPEELDKISDLYSNGEYLDSLIKEISSITLNNEIEIDKKVLEVQLKYQSQQQISLEGSTYPIAQVTDAPKIITVPSIRPVWKNRLDIISFKLNPIYDSTIVSKLKKIAKLK